MLIIRWKVTYNLLQNINVMEFVPILTLNENKYNSSYKLHDINNFSSWYAAAAAPPPPPSWLLLSPSWTLYTIMENPGNNEA